MVDAVLPAADSSEKTGKSGLAGKLGGASLRQRILSGAFWALVGRAGSVGALFATNVLLGRTLSVGEFSAYAVAAAAVILLGMPATFGVPKVLLRAIRTGVHSHRGDVLEAAWSSAWRLMTLSCIIVAIVYMTGAHFLLGDAPKWSAVRNYALLTAGWMCLSAFLFAVSHALQGFDDFRSSVLVGARNGGVMPNVMALAIMLALASIGQLSLRTALFVQVAVNVVTCVAAVRLVRRAMRRARAQNLLVGNDEATSSVVDAPPMTMRWFFSESWPNLLVQFTSLGLIQTELLMVSSLVGEREIAAYTAVQRLLEVLAGGQVLATTIVGPFIAELYVKQDLRKLEMVVRGAASLMAIPTMFFLLIFLAFPAQTLTYTFGPSFAVGATALRIVAIGASISSFSGVNGLTMIMVGRQRELLRASVVAFGCYLILAPVLIHFFGIVGAATAISVVFGAYNIVVTLMVKKAIGVWTIPTVAPDQLKAALRALRRRS